MVIRHEKALLVCNADKIVDSLGRIHSLIAEIEFFQLFSARPLGILIVYRAVTDLLGVILLLFRRSRKAGATILIALLLGLLITNLCVKPLVARPRPYADELSVFFTRWQEIGHGLENEVDSFPSGHATAAFGAMFALFWCGNKKYSWAAFIPALLIGFSRVYIYVHYASDIIGGAVAGLVTGTVAFLLIGLLWKRLTASENKAAKFVTTASIVNLFHRA